MKKQIWFICITAFLVWLSIIVVQSFSQQSPDEKMQTLMERWNNNKMKCKISGTIISSDGTPITGVTAKIREGMSITGDEYIDSERLLTSSAFSIVSRPCQSMSITLDKDGYYPETIAAGNIFSYFEGDATMINNNTIVTPPMTVVLEPVGELLPASSVSRLKTVFGVKKNGPDMELGYIKFPFDGLGPDIGSVTLFL